MASVKHCISLREDLSEYAQNMSHKLFQDNLSIFIGYLVSCYKEGTIAKQIDEQQNVTQEGDEISSLADDLDSFFDKK